MLKLHTWIRSSTKVLATVETAIASQQPGSRPRLERTLKEAEHDFRYSIELYIFSNRNIVRNLLKNPPPNAQDLELLKKATTDGIKLPGSEISTTLPASLVEEAIIVSELFKLNEISSVLLLLQGEEQLPRYPGLTRGLVAVLLYYDGRAAIVQALRALVAATPGLSWSTDTAPDIAELVKETSTGLMKDGLTDVILGLLSSLDWTADLAGLQKAAALGDAQHVHTVRALHQETRQGLADIVYRYSAQVGLSAQAVTRILEHLAKATPDTATGQLDGVTAALAMAVISAMDVSGVGRGEVELPIVKDSTFLATVGREVEGRSRKWECPGLSQHNL